MDGARSWRPDSLPGPEQQPVVRRMPMSRITHARFLAEPARLTVGLVILLAVGALLQGCVNLVLNQTAELTGNVSILFINDTPYRASFSYASWNSLDRDPPGTINFRQLRLAPYASNGPVTLTCARNVAIGTEEMYQRVIDTEANQTATFDPDAFDTVVHFSDQPADSELAAIATVGTAVGSEKLLGVHFECGDELIFTFVEDPDVPGGFRVDYALIKAEP